MLSAPVMIANASLGQESPPAERDATVGGSGSPNLAEDVRSIIHA
jgi:hypothetical protein